MNRIVLSLSKILAVLGVLSLVFLGTITAHAENIDPDNDGSQYGTSLVKDTDSNGTNDRIDFESGDGMTVSAAGTEGEIWGEMFGLIDTSTGTLTCSNGVGTFGGVWWSNSKGLINIDPDGGGLTLSADGEITGTVWNPIEGPYSIDIKTSYTCPSDNTNNNNNDPSATCNLYVSPSVINPRESVVLSWENNFSTDNDINEARISGFGNYPDFYYKQGSILVYINQTTTFEATFRGDNRRGTATCSVIIEVEEPDDPNDEGVCTDSTALLYVNPLNLDSDQYSDPSLCQYGPDTRQGVCTDSSALSYVDPLGANQYSDPSLCQYGPDTRQGVCTDPAALSYVDPLGPDQYSDPSRCQYDTDVPADEDVNTLRLEEIWYRAQVGQDDTVVLVVMRPQGDSALTATLRFFDDTARRGVHYNVLEEYTLQWEEGDTSNQFIIVNIPDIEYDTRTKNFTAELTSDTGVVLERYDVAHITLVRETDIPLVASVIAAIVAFAVAATTLPFRIQNILLAIPGYRRRHRPWGTVYDAESKQPLDPAYVQLLDENGEEVASSITDLDGRYGFLTEPGTYYLKAGKTHYSFPSEYLRGQTKDNMYTSLYFGEPIQVVEKGQVIAKDIPMDATGDDWNEKAKRSMKVAQFFSRHDGLAHRIIDILFVLGLAFSIYATVTSPVWYNFAILGLYAVILVVMIIGITTRAFGKVTDKNGNPIPGAIVRAYNAHLNKEVAHRIVGANGLYYMLVQKGTYYITVEAPTQTDEMKHVYTSDSFNASSGMIKRKITVASIKQ